MKTRNPSQGLLAVFKTDKWFIQRSSATNTHIYMGTHRHHTHIHTQTHSHVEKGGRHIILTELIENNPPFQVTNTY